MVTTENITSNRFATVKQLPLYYPAFTESSIRWLIFNEKSNGFYRCIRRIGRKVLIDIPAFENWVAEQQGDGK